MTGVQTCALPIYLYGSHLSVALVDFLRPEMKFDGIDALVTQMGADCARARAILA